MRRAPQWLRNPLQGTRQILALALTALLFWCSVASVATVTPKGIQCPTAPVQSVLVAKRDCCDRIIGYEVRKPKEGEKGFLQCRCAEKRSAQHDGNEHSNLRFEVSFAFEAPLALVVPSRLPEVRAEDTYVARLTMVPSPPFVRPPLAA